jgi:trk system potassium uptake protein
VLYISDIYPTFEEAFRIGLFQFVSATSNTGFGTASVGGVWGAGPILIMCAGMFTGAAAGSTVGGIKLIRAITLSKGILWRVSNVFYPSSAVRQFKLGERRLTDDELSREFEEAAIVAILWVIFLAIGIAVLIIALPSDTPLEHLIFEVISAQSTVGLSAGITGPSMPTSTKIMFLLNMWVGRLEIIPVVVLLRGIFKGLDYYE